MSKIAALDLGDQWIGIAISDSAKLFARPYITVKAKELISFLTLFLEKENIESIVVGLPKTMNGNISEQTQKVINLKDKLEIIFFQVKWILWDERLSSKRAQELYKNKKDKDKQKEHAIAAAFILDSYLTFLPK